MLLCFIWLHIVGKFSFLWNHLSFIFLTYHEPTVLQYCYHDLVFLSVFFLFNASLFLSLFNFLCPSTLSLLYTYIINAIVYTSGFFNTWQTCLSFQSRFLTPAFFLLPSPHILIFFPKKTKKSKFRK